MCKICLAIHMTKLQRKYYNDSFFFFFNYEHVNILYVIFIKINLFYSI